MDRRTHELIASEIVLWRRFVVASAIGMATTVVASAEPVGAGGGGLLDEPFLHPLDAFTAQTLHAGEVLYAQPLGLLPGWAQVGVTDAITVEIDATALLGGFFIDPHLPVPSTNIRWRLFDGGTTKPSVAVEAMAQYLWKPFDQEKFDHLLVRRRHLGGFLHANLSLPLAPHLWLHVSAGVSYARSILITNVDRPESHGTQFQDLVAPDASLAIDWRATRWLALAATASWGSTFVYSDNQPRKLQFTYGARFAPFLWSSHGSLRTLRIELAAIGIYRSDAKELLAAYVPVFPYIYWHWRW